MLSEVERLLIDIELKRQECSKKGLIKLDKPQDQISEKEIPFKLPNTWKWIRLGDYCLKVTDYVASGSFASLKENVNYYNTENYALMVKTADFSNGFSTNLTYTDEKGYNFLRNSNLFGGELILSNIGSIGKIFKVPFLNRPMTLASNTIMLKFTDDELNDYVYYYLKSTYGQGSLWQIASGTSVPKFNKTQLKSIIIPIPCLKVQKRIVEALDKAQELIDKRKAQIEALDELVKSRFIEMFGGEKYTIVKTEDVCEYITKGTTPKTNEILTEYSEGLVPYLKVYNLSFDGSMLFEEKPQYVSYETHNKLLSRSKVFSNDVLMNIVGPPLGKFAIVPNTHAEWNINQAIAIFRATNRINPIYLLYALKQPNVLRPFIDSAVGIRQQNLSLLQCRHLEIPLPPLGLQNEFADFVNQVDKLKFKMQKSLTELEDNFNSLMQKAFKGELFN